MIKLEEKLGVKIPTVLLPHTNVNLSKWSVVACDQYTSQPAYWNQVEEIIGDSHSTLHIIFPEVFLEEADAGQRIEKINANMRKYLSENILVPQKPGFIYIDRQTTHAESRKGLILAVDLEKYDYTKGSQTLIRATEGTVIERLPPRIKIRENACIELPHIMLLIDDPEKTVIEPLAEMTDQLQKLYDFELMMDGSQIKGFKIDDEKIIETVLTALEKLADPVAFQTKYQVNEDKGVLLFAVGDGNHSLASAKGHWENVKQNLTVAEREDHPARYALVEVVNVHDDGLKFEPIHRVLFTASIEDLLRSAVEYYQSKNSKLSCQRFDSKTSMEAQMKSLGKAPHTHVLPFIAGVEYGLLIVENPSSNLEVGTLQLFLDNYLNKNPEVKIDYIHGEEVVDSLGSKEGNIGFYLPPMEKTDLFKTVILDGVLPRKTFSMGEAEEKRFYLECRKIVKDEEKC